eukprot:NODE_3992_length_880_cov_45.061372_g3680_i0.p1 GENE.NODE_3992_length_880_cov_45.061372_g3680_i0~~NODE_3992_length_880_cov_45.061372_g3680_i0.p1  ORF type:complete len:258 (+),score=54.61 NODE_3992_length_880_cov_45.061372_g3680_i0:88-774(+)
MEDSPSSAFAAIMDAAEDDENAAYSGLTLLSCIPVLEEEGPTAKVANPDRVGLRPPMNEARGSVKLLSNTAATTAHSSQSAYVYYCTQYGIRPNSGVISILPSMVGSFTLQELNLSGNFVGDRGLLPLLEVIRLNRSLHTLRLRDNGLRNSGVECLVDMALGHPGLRNLDLGSNHITLGGAKVLLELVRTNHRIQTLLLGGTRIDEQFRQAIANLLKQRNSSTPASAS